MSNTIQLKRASANTWERSDIVLARGEVGIELSPTGMPRAMKIGNGLSRWNNLPYMISPPVDIPEPQKYSIKHVSSDSDNPYVVNPDEDRFIMVDSTSSTMVILLPSLASMKGKLLTIKSYLYGNRIVIETVDGVVIDGVDAMSISNENEYVTLLGDPIGVWHIVGGNVTLR